MNYNDVRSDVTISVIDYKSFSQPPASRKKINGVCQNFYCEVITHLRPLSTAFVLLSSAINNIKVEQTFRG